MSDSFNGLYQLDKDDVERAAEALARAFYDDPLMQHVFSDEECDSSILISSFQIPLRYCLRHGQMYAPTSEIEGVALWLPSNKYPIKFWRLLSPASLWRMFKMIRKIGRDRLKKMSHIGAQLDKMHKRLATFEHTYLWVLGVDPEHQGNGYASKLLRPMFDWLDDDGMPCYLDTLTEKNAAMYEHLGFEVIEKMNIPDTDITAWAMLREPGGI